MTFATGTLGVRSSSPTDAVRKTERKHISFTRLRVMEEIEKCDCPHFLILFRDSKLQFRALYAYYPDTEEVFKIHGVGPRQVTDNMMDHYFKYNSGGKKFSQIHTKHLTATIDAP